MNTEQAEPQVIEDPAETARGFALAYIALYWLVALFLIPFAAFLADPRLFGYVDSIVTFVGWGTLLSLAIGGALLIRLAWRRGSRIPPIIAAILLAAHFVFGTTCGWDISLKARCGAWQLKHASVLRAYGQEMYTHIAKHGEPIPSLLIHVLTSGGNLYEVHDNPCGTCRYREVLVGRYTLDDYLSGAITIEELAAESERIGTAAEPWERIGNFVISRDAGIWRSNDSRLITGYADIGGHFDSRGYNILYADVHVESHFIEPPIADVQNLIHSIARARFLGFPEPPQDFLDAFGITEEQIAERLSEFIWAPINADSEQP